MFEGSHFTFDWKGFRYAILSMGVGFFVLQSVVPYAIPHIVASMHTVSVGNGTLVADVYEGVSTTSKPLQVYSPTSPWEKVRTLSLDSAVSRAGELIAIDIPAKQVKIYRDGKLHDTYQMLS